jgi:predicted HicB family RNase H-like nuclease
LTIGVKKWYHSGMKYKDYVGHVIYDGEAKIFHGEVMGLRDVITFQGSTVKELEKAFKDSIDDYLAFCKERGEKNKNPCLTFSVKHGLHF